MGQSKVIVYKIANTVNDRLYVGITTCKLEKRWREHRCAANKGHSKPLYAAMRKYGVENFSIVQIDTASTTEELREKELQYISKYRSHCMDNGYNLTDHGIAYGCVSTKKGEQNYRSKLTEEIVAFVRDTKYKNESNAIMLRLVIDKFQCNVAKDTLRDARRGDAWAHLNDKYPPIKAQQGSRKPALSEDQKAAAKQVLDKYRQVALEKLAAQNSGKRGKNAKLSEDSVKEIFFSTSLLRETASQYGISKKMVSLIKQRKAHVYLTKDL